MKRIQLIVSMLALTASLATAQAPKPLTGDQKFALEKISKQFTQLADGVNNANAQLNQLRADLFSKATEYCGGSQFQLCNGPNSGPGCEKSPADDWTCVVKPKTPATPAPVKPVKDEAKKPEK